MDAVRFSARFAVGLRCLCLRMPISCFLWALWVVAVRACLLRCVLVLVWVWVWMWFGFRVLSVIGLCGLLASLVGLVISCFLAFWWRCIILFCSCGLVVWGCVAGCGGGFGVGLWGFCYGAFDVACVGLAVLCSSLLLISWSMIAFSWRVLMWCWIRFLVAVWVVIV